MNTKRWTQMVNAGALGLLLAVFGCAGAADEHPPSVDTSEGTDTDTDTDTDTEQNTPENRRPRRRCESGTVKECTIYLRTQGSVQNCYPGLAVCSDGRWSDCLSIEDAEDELESMEDH